MCINNKNNGCKNNNFYNFSNKSIIIIKAKSISGKNIYNYE